MGDLVSCLQLLQYNLGRKQSNYLHQPKLHNEKVAESILESNRILLKNLYC